MEKKPLEDVNVLKEEIVLPARTDAMPKAVEFVCAYAREMAFSDERIGEIRLALEETLGNIIRFACPTGSEEITIKAGAHEMGPVLLNIIDNGKPFNMLVLSAFPEFLGESKDEMPPTTRMRKLIRDIEYRRDGAEEKNILAWVISK